MKRQILYLASVNILISISRRTIYLRGEKFSRRPYARSLILCVIRQRIISFCGYFRRLPIRPFSGSVLPPQHFQSLPFNLCRSHRLFLSLWRKIQDTSIIPHLGFMLFPAKEVWQAGKIFQRKTYRASLSHINAPSHSSCNIILPIRLI